VGRDGRSGRLGLSGDACERVDSNSEAVRAGDSIAQGSAKDRPMRAARAGGSFARVPDGSTQTARMKWLPVFRRLEITGPIERSAPRMTSLRDSQT